MLYQAFQELHHLGSICYRLIIYGFGTKGLSSLELGDLCHSLGDLVVEEARTFYI